MGKGRRLSKILTLCFCVLLLWHFSFIASSAKEAEVRMASIADYGTNLVISDDGIASVSGWVTGKTGVTSTYVKVTLQKSILGIFHDSVSSMKGGMCYPTLYQVDRNKTHFCLLDASCNGKKAMATWDNVGSLSTNKRKGWNNRFCLLCFMFSDSDSEEFL